MEWMGGKEKFGVKVDGMLREEGYWEGNEGWEEVGLMFNYGGEGWKREEGVGDMMKSEYLNGGGGV